MATISSPGIGSGLDVRSIVSQLVDIERRPLTKLQAEAAAVQAKISIFGEIKSFVSALSGAASSLSSLTTWNAVKATSSKPDLIGASASGNTAAANLSVRVDQLAQAQSFASASFGDTGAIGGGSITIQQGTYGPAPDYTFTPNVDTDPLEIPVSATDTLADVAQKINDLDGLVQATILNDGTGQRLVLTSRETGEATGFSVSVSDNDGNDTDGSGLSRLIDSGPGNTALVTQYGADARITVNNSISVRSSTNVFNDVVSGLTLTLAPSAEIGDTAQIGVAPDQDAVRKAIDGFVTAYNDLNTYLTEATKYDAGAKRAGALQGDSFAVGMQNTLRSILQSSTSGSAFARLADIGVTQQLGGALSVDSAKLDGALKNPDELSKLFRQDTGTSLTSGLALKIKSFTDGLLNADGLFKSKEDALKRALDNNSREQDRVNEKAARVEQQLNRRYSALDAKLSGLTALNNYVAQQVTLWNKSQSN